jgi:hypothetical protein
LRIGELAVFRYAGISQRHLTVAHLEELYTVVAGLALTEAITHLIDRQAKMVPIHYQVLPYFLVFVVTLVPLYHGALRHLDNTYLKEGAVIPRRGAFLVDWLLLFIEACSFFGLAILTDKPAVFSYAFLGLLVFDAAWAFGAYLAFSDRSAGFNEEAKWSIVNGCAVVALILMLVFIATIDESKSTLSVDNSRWIVLLTVAAARSIADYVWCWQFYFPTHDGEEDGRATAGATHSP